MWLEQLTPDIFLQKRKQKILWNFMIDERIFHDQLWIRNDFTDNLKQRIERYHENS